MKYHIFSHEISRFSDMSADISQSVHYFVLGKVLSVEGFMAMQMVYESLLYLSCRLRYLRLCVMKYHVFLLEIFHMSADIS